MAVSYIVVVKTTPILLTRRVPFRHGPRYDNRLWNQKYAMRAYEVDKDGTAIITITVPHESGALESQGGYRFIPMATTGGESNTAPFDLAT